MLGSQASRTVEESNEAGPSVNDSVWDTLEYIAEQLLKKTLVKVKEYFW